MAEIEVRKLRKMFGDFTAVQGSTFTVDDGEFFVMLGPSGCGKTTTLRMIAGLELPTGGQILLDGQDVTFNRASHRDIAFMFQMEYRLSAQMPGVAPVRDQGPGSRDRGADAHRPHSRFAGVGPVRR